MSLNRSASSGTPRLDAPVIADIAHLGGRGTLYLLSLLQATQHGEPLAPTPEATASVLSLLDALGVIRVEGPLAGTNAVMPESMPWTYTWCQVPFEQLPDRLVVALCETRQNSFYAQTWLRIWKELVCAEVAQYLQQQLTIHRFGNAFMQQLYPLLTWAEDRYSLGQWRYACWASARSMASMRCDHPGNEELINYTLRSELPRRLKIASLSLEEKFCLPAMRTSPSCTLSKVFYNFATDLGENFWKSAPTDSLLKP